MFPFLVSIVGSRGNGIQLLTLDQFHNMIDFFGVQRGVQVGRGGGGGGVPFIGFRLLNVHCLSSLVFLLYVGGIP